MARVIATIEAWYGGVTGYLEAGGLRPAEIEQLRERLR
jgi:hypothetical protein